MKKRAALALRSPLSLAASARSTLGAGLLAILGLTPPAAALPQRGVFEPPFHITIPGPTAPFTVLDSIEGSHVDFVYPAINPMVLRRPSGQLFVANCHAGEIVRFEGATATLVIPAPNGVMGLAHWVSSIDEYEELIALSRGNYGLTFFDPDTGDMTDYLPLPAEPADMLLVEDDLFVSCAADSVVLQIDLENRSIVHTYSLTGAIAYSRLFEHDGRVYVTAQHSGNNSIVLRGPGIGAGGQVTLLNQNLPPFADGPLPILDASNPVVSPTGGLPDEDVVCIDPGTQTVDVAVKNAGTTLAAAGVHPGTGEVWILNMEANNKDAGAQSEPLINGNFVFNRITKTTLGGGGSSPTVAAGTDFVSLDDLTVVGAPGEAVGHPYDLDFHADGTVFVIGLLTDNVVRLDAGGALLQRWNLPAGSIPRDLLIIESQQRVLVYCWGTNKVATIDLASGQVLSEQLDVGYDPTSAIRKEGRALFYDGHNSAKGNASCESCHIEGGMDFVAWDLSNRPFDDKGPMQTQNLKNIGPLNPYHWRGERAGLIDFNPAFSGLLGGTDLAPEEFEKFEAFVFGMHEPANPRTNPERVVVGSGPEVQQNFNVKGDVLHPALSAVNGQSVYFTKPNVGPSACQDCHALPTGTINEFFHDGIIDQDHRSSFDVPAYNGLWRKEQKSRVTLSVVNQMEVRPPLGLGTAHSGSLAGVYEFVTEQFAALTVTERQDVALFLHQLDSGVAPTVHSAALLSAAHLASEDFIRFLMEQAVARNCDLGAFGAVTTGGSTQRLRWWYDPSIDRFVCEDGSQPDRRLRYFLQKAIVGEVSVLFVGLPRGMGRRWSIDRDDDGLRNLDEAGHGASPTDPDSDGDGFFDGVEVAHGGLPDDPLVVPNDTDAPQITRFELIYKTARVAKFIVETNEPCTLSASYDIEGTVVTDAVTIDEYGRHMVVLLRELEPSYSTEMLENDVTVTVTVTDQSNNQAQATAPSFVTEEFILATEQNDPNYILEETIVKQLGMPAVTVEGAGYRVQCDVLIHHQKRKTAPELADRSLIARVLVKPAGATEFVPAIEENLQMDGFPGLGPQPPLPYFLNSTFGLPFPGPLFLYLGLGPFVASPATDASGLATLEFLLTDAPTIPGSPVIGQGAEVVISVESVLKVDPLDWPTSLAGTDRVYHFPATPVDARATEPVSLP